MPKTPNPPSRPWQTYVAVFAAGILVGLVGFKVAVGFSSHQHTREAIPTPAARPFLKRDTGSWGTLDALRIPLEDPADFFPDRAVRLRPAHWFFEGYSENSLSNFLGACELTASQKSELLDPSHWQATSNGWTVAPSETLVRTLNATTREHIYSVLAASSQNYPQQFPFRFHPEDLPERMAESELPAPKLHDLRQLLYTNAGTVCFSDVQVLPSMLSSNELESTISALYSIPAYRLRLIVFPDSDIEPILRYWARGSDAARLRPLLESYTRLRDTNGASLNISYLFPAFARLRLYTFPKELRDPMASKEDCFWTSMNFFNDEPDARFLDPAYVRTVLQNEYSVIQDHPSYGDLITLVGPSGDGRHMCVYLADDFVYTKNGKNPLAPWVVMKLSDMLVAFTAGDHQRMVVVRHKNHSVPNGGNGSVGG